MRSNESRRGGGGEEQLWLDKREEVGSSPC